MVIPHAGIALSKSTHLVVEAHGPVGIASVWVVATGSTLTHPLTFRTVTFPYGWIGAWNTSTVPNGAYQLHSVATGLDGRSVTSRTISVTVSN